MVGGHVLAFLHGRKLKIRHRDGERTMARKGSGNKRMRRSYILASWYEDDRVSSCP